MGAPGHQTYQLRRGPLVEGEDYEVDADGCWVWLRRIAENGYGRLGGRWAHRVAWRERHGREPAQLDHLCRKRACVNPDHLQEVTAAENGWRSPLRTRKLAPADVRAMRASNESSYQLAARYGIDPSYAWRVKTRRAWQALP